VSPFKKLLVLLLSLNKQLTPCPRKNGTSFADLRKLLNFKKKGNGKK